MHNGVTMHNTALNVFCALAGNTLGQLCPQQDEHINLFCPLAERDE